MLYVDNGFDYKEHSFYKNIPRGKCLEYHPYHKTYSYRKYHKKSDNIHNHIFLPNTVGKCGLFRLAFRKEYDRIRVFSCSEYSNVIGRVNEVIL